MKSEYNFSVKYHVSRDEQTEKPVVNISFLGDEDEYFGLEQYREIMNSATDVVKGLVSKLKNPCGLTGELNFKVKGITN